MQKITGFQLDQIDDILNLLEIADQRQELIAEISSDRTYTLSELTEKEGFQLTMNLIAQLKHDVLRIHIVNTAYEYKMYGVESNLPGVDNFIKIDKHLESVGEPKLFEHTEADLNNLLKTTERLGVLKRNEEADRETKSLLEELNLPTKSKTKKGSNNK